MELVARDWNAYGAPPSSPATVVLSSQGGADDKFLQINTSIPQPRYVRNTLLFFPNTIPELALSALEGGASYILKKLWAIQGPLQKFIKAIAS